jgi:hypothetical protein
MRRILLFIIVNTFSFSLFAKDVKITVSPSESKIYIDGNYVADGMTIASLKKKDGFIVLKFEKEGYVTLETRMFAEDKRKAVQFVLKRDTFYDNSTISGNANKFFSQEISDKFLENSKDNKEASILVWKMIHQIILNYFDEIETSDQLSGFVQTPWKYKTFAEANMQVRTRITVKETNLGGKLTYKIKVSSEMASLNSSHRDENFQETTRLLKEFEPMISEFQSRLGNL